MDDDRAFHRIREKYHRAILAYLAQDRALQEEDRQDLAQEILVRIYQNIQKFDEKRSPGPLVYRISRNCLIDFKRYKKTRIHLWKRETDTEPVSHYPEPETQYMQGESYSNLLEIMETLSTRSRRILFLHYWEEMTCREIGKAMGMPSGTVKYELYRLRREIKRRWDEKR